MVDNVKCGAREIPLKSLYLEKLSDFCLRSEVSILEMMNFCIRATFSDKQVIQNSAKRLFRRIFLHDKGKHHPHLSTSPFRHRRT